MINFSNYEEFVAQVTSNASTNFVDFADRIGELDREGANIERLLTAGVGINAEGGEFLEIIKKMVFQGKPWTDDNREHLIIELGDLLWYVESMLYLAIHMYLFARHWMTISISRLETAQYINSNTTK